MISVCLTTYDGEKYIIDQLQSILYQLGKDDEVIVSDDNSIDKTLEQIRSLCDARIKIIHNHHKNGILSNVENALNNAHGDIIFLADQDDIWLPNKVNRCLEVLQTNDLVISDCYVTDKDLNVINDSFFHLNRSLSNKWRALIRNPYLGCCMAFNRKVLEKSLPFPAKIPMHDIWIGNLVAFNFKVSFINEKLIYYRRHGSNLSTASEPSKYGILKQINFRFILIKELIKLSFKNKQIRKSVMQ